MATDYEQKYKEALERARKLYNDAKANEYKSDMEDYESIFPELKEIEDEWIRKALIEALTVSKSIGELKFRLPEPTREECIAWLEKQKENPKSIDSIQSDCMSNVKCEYRWHKVGDSLPDNPREVLCKDEAGNYFIGRYYSGEGWEISNYDDEDKPHHLNPPVSKWIDFPSEKQKDQKPAIKLVFPKFRVGDIIRNVHDESDKTTRRISYVGEHGYNFDYRHLGDKAGGGSFGFCYEDYYELVEQKPAGRSASV